MSGCRKGKAGGISEIFPLTLVSTYNEGKSSHSEVLHISQSQISVAVLLAIGRVGILSLIRSASS
jgi:hypothetical protein